MQDFFNVIKALDGPLALCDNGGRILAHSSSFAAHCQQPERPLIGASLLEVWEPEQHSALRDFLASLKDQPASKSPEDFCGQSLRVQAVHMDGQWVILCQSTSPRFDDPLLHFFTDHVNHGFWDYDVENDLYTVSNEWRRMRGVGPDFDINALGERWLDHIHPNDHTALIDALGRLLSGEVKAFNVQYRRQHEESGEWIWLYCRARMIAADADGRALRVVGTDTDITDIKKDESRLEQLNNKIELAITVAGIGIFEFDLNTSRVFWDDRLLAIYGLPAGENDRSGRDWETFIHPDDADDTLAYVAECGLTLSDLKRDFRIVRPDGQVRHLRSMARHIRLSPSETKLIGVNIDVTEDVLRTKELENVRQQLEFESRHDALTGLANRRLLDETIAEVKADTDDTEMCVMHIDLDHFKEINDSHGHGAGDAVLVHVAKTLSSILEDATLIARFGGDEFTALFAPAPPQSQIEALAERVIAACGHPYIFEGQSCVFGVSIGSATGTDKKTVTSQADIALYAAKESGRSRYRAFSDRRNTRSDRYLRRRQDLLDALAERKIECWYQPQFDAATHQIVGAEALARLRQNEHTVCAPEDFLPLAQKSGLLGEIEEFIFASVLEDQNQWSIAGLLYPEISVNISSQRLMEPSLLKRLTEQLRPHHLVALEILETAFLDDPETPVLETIRALRALGLAIDLDDFGSGHASVLSLLAVKPDRVKIDQRLTRDIATSQNAVTILGALITIARTQNMGVVLEGIETAEQLAATQRIDCDVLQGYALGAPISGIEFSAMLTSDARRRVGDG